MTKRQTERPWRSLTPERIRNARLALGLSQEDFALLLGRRHRKGFRPLQHHISRWETGERRPANLWGPPLIALVVEVEKKIEERRRERDIQTLG